MEMDSPLDFSTKKVKLDHRVSGLTTGGGGGGHVAAKKMKESSSVVIGDGGIIGDDLIDPDSPCSPVNDVDWKKFYYFEPTTKRDRDAYPKYPMSFSAAMGIYGLPSVPGTTEALLHQQSHAAYTEFRKQMLSQPHMSKSRRGGQRNNGQALSDSTISSPNEPPLNYGSMNGMDGTGTNSSADDSHSAPEDSGLVKNCGKTEQQQKDEAYWERRRKNNEAAKRSRDARRAKESELAIRAAFLEQENLKLRFELCALKNETTKLRHMLYTS